MPPLINVDTGNILKIVRWEEEKKDTGVKWNFLEHKGPIFAPAYERLPSNVRFYYDGGFCLPLVLDMFGFCF